MGWGGVLGGDNEAQVVGLRLAQRQVCGLELQRGGGTPGEKGFKVREVLFERVAKDDNVIQVSERAYPFKPS